MNIVSSQGRPEAGAQRFVLLVMMLLLIGFPAFGLGAGESGLKDSSWELIQIDARPPRVEAEFTLDFGDRDGSGVTGCNQISFEYRVRGDRLILRDLVSTVMACDLAGVMAEEEQVWVRLNALDRYSIAGNRLTLSSAEEVLLVFARR